ncbi:LEF-12 [Spodoptera littoralis nucleopolyhedrovirus]|uniref:LEF-12 n=1 Tax=Spodoptera littoralis nuclear polyhedrosis virus TaxID=10456 RepID=M1JNR4_NPVSL|nr:LEF-12 [Spodoptera littoralis nucleopolyhedrovirus]AGE89888.1 LEF-12 [Spodoptera littoralis nucleopolyhedrovirus]AYU75225.1 LEF-12 late expression factor 12 [Spodoptera littoralis nucleopolyhedrovirus]
MNVVKVLNIDKFNERLARIQSLLDVANSALGDMIEADEISPQELSTLRVSDDTAAWVCGRIETSNCVTLRIKCSESFRGSKVLIERHFYDEHFHQAVVKNLNPDREHYIYWKYTIPMIKLIFCRNEAAYHNPIQRLDYSINVQDSTVETRDCDHVRAHAADVPLDPMNDYDRTINSMQDLVEERYDDKTVQISCNCLR